MNLKIVFTDEANPLGTYLAGIKEPIMVVNGRNVLFRKLQGKEVDSNWPPLKREFNAVQFLAIPQALYKYQGPARVVEQGVGDSPVRLRRRFDSDQSPGLIFNAVLPSKTRLGHTTPLNLTVFRSLDHLKHFVPTQA